INKGEIHILHHFQKMAPGGIGFCLNRCVNMPLFTFFQRCQQKLVLHQGISACESHTAFGTPVIKVPAEQKNQLLYRHLPDTLFEHIVGTDGCTFKSLTFLAYSPGNRRFPLRTPDNGVPGTDVFTGSASLVRFAHIFREHDMFFISPALRIRAPTAFQRTSLKKHIGSAPRSVMDGKTLDIKNQSFWLHTCSLSGILLTCVCSAGSVCPILLLITAAGSDSIFIRL